MGELSKYNIIDHYGGFRIIKAGVEKPICCCDDIETAREIKESLDELESKAESNE